MTNDGVTDEQRVAAFRDRYGKVLYEAMQRDLGRINPGRTPDHPWEEIARGGRKYYGVGAEAVIDAFVSGDSSPPPPGAAEIPIDPDGIVPADMGDRDVLREIGRQAIELERQARDMRDEGYGFRYTIDDLIDGLTTILVFIEEATHPDRPLPDAPPDAAAELRGIADGLKAAHERMGAALREHHMDPDASEFVAGAYDTVIGAEYAVRAIAATLDGGG